MEQILLASLSKILINAVEKLIEKELSVNDCHILYSIIKDLGLVLGEKKNG